MDRDAESSTPRIANTSVAARQMVNSITEVGNTSTLTTTPSKPDTKPAGCPDACTTIDPNSISKANLIQYLRRVCYLWPMNKVASVIVATTFLEER